MGLGNQGSETSSDEETPSQVEASEEDALPRMPSVSQSDSEVILCSIDLPRQEDDSHDLEDDAVFNRGTEVENGEG